MSGSATNSGIDYQQRISAIFSIYLYTQFDISGLFSLNRELIIDEISFETSSPIDDLNIICRQGEIIYFQIKRKISLSKEPGSDFKKVIKQFIDQFMSDTLVTEYYILITTSESSRKITKDLNKILESIRLNDLNFSENPLNSSEKETFEVFRSLIKSTFESEHSKRLTEDDFIKFCQKIHVSQIDIERKMHFEKIALMLLSTKVKVNPELVWGLLIKNCISYAAKRQSINLKGINNLLSKYEKKNFINTENAKSDEIFSPKLISVGSKYSCGKDILLVESSENDCDYLIVELIRFDEDSKKRIEFFDGKVRLLKNGIEWKVVFRSATHERLIKYFEENKNFFKDKKIAHIKSNIPKNLEDSDAVRLHREYSKKLIGNNKNVTNCLHCGYSLFNDDGLCVEIDEHLLNPAIGLIHKNCLRPLDRVLGCFKIDVPEEYSGLPGKIDLSLWFKLLINGQGLMRNAEHTGIFNEDIKQIGWSSEFEHDSSKEYCLKYNLKDGQAIYSTKRLKLQRFSKAEAEDNATFITNKMKEVSYKENPNCYTSKNYVFGDYSNLLKIKDDDEELIEVSSVEVEKYSSLIGKLYSEVDNYYTPIGIILEPNNEAIIGFGNIIPLISDPFKCILFRGLEKTRCAIER